MTRPDFWSYQAKRGFGEYTDDVHYSDLRGGNGSYTFNGSGIEVIVTRDPDSRTVYYTLDGNGSSLWVPLNHYAPVRITGTSVFRYPNLVPGTYTVGFQNGGNHQGINFSFVRLTSDAFRVYKGESSSATPLFWGETGMGGSGIWDVGTTANWYDGVSANKWFDLGGRDYAADFGGKPGTVAIGNGVNANRLTFRTDGYTLQGGTLTLTGIEPTISTADGVKAAVASAIAGSEGLTKAGAGTLVLTGMNSYSGGTKVKAGTLAVKASATLGASNLTVADEAVCALENPKGALATTARVSLNGKGKLSLAAGVLEKIATLTINGVAQPAGIYRSATHPEIIAGAGVLSVAGGDAGEATK